MGQSLGHQAPRNQGEPDAGQVRTDHATDTARDGASAREIGRTLGVARSTIQDNLKRATTAGLAWPLAGDLTDAVLEQRLFAYAGVKSGFRRRVEPDWACLACELKRPGVNLMGTPPRAAALRLEALR